MTTFTDEVRETVSPHKFGGSRMAAACWLISLDGSADEETGDANEWQYHASRIGRRVLYTDSQGFVWVDTYDSELQAVRAFEADDRAYGEVLEAQEAEATAYAEGFRPTIDGIVDCFMPGDAVKVLGYEGIAFRVDGFPEWKGPDYDWTGLVWTHPHRRLVHMVGDDREYDVHIDELTSLDEAEFCSGCGQIGCGWC